MANLAEWIQAAVFGDGEHQGHEARFFPCLNGWAWCDQCGCWEQAEPIQEVA